MTPRSIDEKITLGEYLDRFMEDVAAHSLRPSTIRSYNYLIRDHVKPEIGHIRFVAMEDHSPDPLYVLAITAGMRKGGLLGLQCDDVDLKQGDSVRMLLYPSY